MLSNECIGDTLKKADFGYVLTVYGCMIEGEGIHKENGFCIKVFE